MKFYEFKETEYYALIGAETEEKAIEFYKETVGDLTDEEAEGNPIEITKKKAKAKLLHVCHGEDFVKAPTEFEMYSNSDEPYLVLIDGDLI